MNNNWDSLLKAIVPLSFMAIWALTSLFNRDSKPKPPARPPVPRPNGAGLGLANRPGEPTLRFSSTSNPMAAATAPRPGQFRGGRDDEIVILSSSSEVRRPDRDQEKRAVAGNAKRATKGKPLVPQRRTEAPSTRARLAGVSQNVNQHLTNTNLEFSPLEAMPTVLSLGLGSAPMAAENQTPVQPLSVTALALNDPAKLREAFILNEVLQPPVSRRPHRSRSIRL